MINACILVRALTYFQSLSYEETTHNFLLGIYDFDKCNSLSQRRKMRKLNIMFTLITGL